MTRSQLPEGVGKKIVEALKRQAEADITPVASIDDTMANTVPLTEIEDLPDIKIDSLNEEPDASENDNIIIEEEAAFVPDEKFNISENINKERNSSAEPIMAESPIFTPPADEARLNTFTAKPAQTGESFAKTISNTVSRVNIPSNVLVLKNLISSLPAGVTKQAGAQIIRQTLDAMGLPIAGVLKEAQELQEELNSSARESLLRIQEYKTNILQLEQSVQEYQKTISQINDLISLFLMTDRK